jgi:hypothetical protein
VRPLAAYAAAAAVGIGAPLVVLWVARSSPQDANPLLAAGAIAAGVGIIAAFLARLAPRHWLALALVASAPVGLLGIVMFGAFVNIGAFFWVWLGVGLGAVAAALIGAWLVARPR